MATKVRLSKDGSNIDYSTSEGIPTSVKKFRKSTEIEGFYRFVFENDLQKDAFYVLAKISARRKAEKKAKKAKTAKTAKMAKAK